MIGGENLTGRYTTWGGQKIIKRKNRDGKCCSCGAEAIEMIMLEDKQVLEVCEKCKYVAEFGLDEMDWN